eukprot:6172398-Amphidinium_carterae.2
MKAAQQRMLEIACCDRHKPTCYDLQDTLELAQTSEFSQQKQKRPLPLVKQQARLEAALQRSPRESRNMCTAQFLDIDHWRISPDDLLLVAPGKTFLGFVHG